MAPNPAPNNLKKVTSIYPEQKPVMTVRNKKRYKTTSQKVNLSPVWPNHHGLPNNTNLCFRARMMTD
jgi:hypothetical protein